jgi:hypothetical protein
MRWYFFVAYFFGGAFLVNAIPHFVNGVSGRSFPTSFASPPGKGQSSPTVNVLWGTANAVAGYFLVAHVGGFQHPQHFRNSGGGCGRIADGSHAVWGVRQLCAKSGVRSDESSFGTAASASPLPKRAPDGAVSIKLGKCSTLTSRKPAISAPTECHSRPRLNHDALRNGRFSLLAFRAAPRLVFASPRMN